MGGALELDLEEERFPPWEWPLSMSCVLRRVLELTEPDSVSMPCGVQGVETDHGVLCLDFLILESCLNFSAEVVGVSCFSCISMG